jgi:hypothetical protein
MARNNPDEDIAMLDTRTPCPSPCYKSSPTQLPCSVRIQPHPFTVLAIFPSTGIETRRIRMHWNGDNDAVVLDVIPAPEDSWIMLCDNDKLLCHVYGPIWPCIMLGLKPRLRIPPNPRSPFRG